MPDPTLEYVQNLTTVLPSAANTIAIMGIASEADQSRVYTYDPGASDASIRTDLGDGTGVEALASTLRYGKRRVVFVPMPADVAGAIGAVTSVRPSAAILGGLQPSLTVITPSAIAAAGNVEIDGPYDTLHVCLKISSAGANGVGKFQYCLDDQVKNGTYNHVGAFSGDVLIPAATPAEIIGTVDLSTIDTTDLNTLTLIIDSDSDGGTAVTTTFSNPANAAAVVSQLNANNGSGVKYVADLVGANKLRIRSISIGATGTLSITGTALTLLGITSGASDTGAPATFSLPNTGVLLTFASGTYVAGDLYTFDTTGPKFASSSLAAAFTRLKAAASSGTVVGAVWAVQEDADAIDCRTMADAFYTQITTAQTDGFDWWGLYQAPRSSKASDADVITYLSDKTARFLVLTARGVRCSGGLLAGSRFHRPASWIAAWHAVRERWSSDLGNRADQGETTESGLTELDGDERTASTKLATYRTPQTGDGGGFTVMETPSNQANVAYFYRGRTMAAFGDVLGDLNAVRLALAVGRQARKTLGYEQNNDDLTTPAGLLTDSAQDRIEGRVRTDLETILFQDTEFPEVHASSIGEIVPLYTAASKTLSAAISVQRKGQFKKVSISIGVVDAIAVQEA